MSEFDDDNQDYQEDAEQVDNELLDDEQDIEDGQDDEQDADGEESESQDDSADDALDFSFDDDGDSSDPFKGQEAPEWVKQVRQENRELKRQLKQRESQQEQQQALREKPTLDAHDYDSDAYEQDYAQWLSEKSQHDAKAQAEQQKYQQYRDRYKADVDAIKVKAPDYDEVESSVVDVLSEKHQGLLQMAADNPAKMVYALGKNSPAQLERLSKLDEVQFVKQITLMEQQMSSKTKSRNSNKPKPKTHELEGAAGGVDTKLAKLEAEADKTGDRSKVAAYKKQLKQKG